MSSTEFNAISNLFDDKPKLELLFEAKKHNFRSEAFHAACDNKGPTLIVAKSKKVPRCIFGWFTTVEWKSIGRWADNKSDSTTWVFKVESPNKVPKYVMKETTKGFLHERDYGPSIYPLIIKDRANQGENCISQLGTKDLIPPAGMEQPSGTYFTGSEVFGLTELEVYSVKE